MLATGMARAGRKVRRSGWLVHVAPGRNSHGRVIAATVPIPWLALKVLISQQFAGPRRFRGIVGNGPEADYLVKITNS